MDFPVRNDPRIIPLPRCLLLLSPSLSLFFGQDGINQEFSTPRFLGEAPRIFPFPLPFPFPLRRDIGSRRIVRRTSWALANFRTPHFFLVIRYSYTCAIP